LDVPSIFNQQIAMLRSIATKQILLLLLLSVTSGVMAREIQGRQKSTGNSTATGSGLRTAGTCFPASSSVSLDVNNVRALLHNGGDMWWDLVGDPRYEVPKIDDNPSLRRYSSFAASLWIGGIDASNQLRIAAQTYRQDGNDFWPGPLTVSGASVDETVCQKWDRHFKVTRAEIDLFKADFSRGAIDFTKYPVIQNWPAHGDPGQSYFLAPYVDVDGDNAYNPNNGDYPKIKGDQAIWWVINDKGNVHTATGGEAIGIEIQMLAFGFATANAINNMTFYSQKVINRSNNTLFDTYIGAWADIDLGNYADDYVGCDTLRGLGFAYNGDADDETARGYGLNPPALGVDFFQGPIGDDGNRIGMSKFVYYENDFSLRGNPEKAVHFYNYLIGRWKDGSQMVNNGRNGFPGTAAGPPTNYMYYGYPGNSSSCTFANSFGWNENTANNTPFDRRLLQSAGPFTLVPGAENEIITGVVWSRGYYDDQFGSVCEVLKADDIAQALFDANFELLTGPDAPILSVEEYDQELMLSWAYNKNFPSNNYNESYAQVDPSLSVAKIADSVFTFQGYMLYQLKDATVTADELRDANKARLIAQCDIKDSVGTIINRYSSPVAGTGDFIITDEVMVQGANKGINSSLRISEDQFASGSDNRLINYKNYYFGIVAYAYNDTTSDGIKFLLGNGNFVNTLATPHKINFEQFGTELNSAFGLGPEVTRIKGLGNGGNSTKITTETEAGILASNNLSTLVYQENLGPISIKVVNPKEVKNSEYMVRLVFDSLVAVRYDMTQVPPRNIYTYADWVLYENNGSGSWTPIFVSEFFNDDTDLSYRPAPLSGTERIVYGHGISLSVNQVVAPGDSNDINNGFITGTITYTDPSKQWLTGLPDVDNSPFNWILSGSFADGRSRPEPQADNATPIYKFNYLFDPKEVFEQILGGTVAPFGMTRNPRLSEGLWGPRPLTSQLPVASLINLQELPDVEIVFTPDRTKWSRCVVVETQADKNLSATRTPCFLARQTASKDINGNVEAGSTGMSYFPGYAINVNTGQRLNVFFGENSWYVGDNGNDMLFNPSPSFAGVSGDLRTEVLAGGHHYVYVTNTPYDGCAAISQFLVYNSPFNYSEANGQVNGISILDSVYRQVAWCTVPIVRGGESRFINPANMPCEARVSLRVNRPFVKGSIPDEHPTYLIDMKRYAAATNNKEVATRSLADQVKVVPNPYYAFSQYESSQLQNLVKITNLPQRCKISIYTLGGQLVRTFDKNSSEAFQNWNLQNSVGVPISSGLYILHINGYELGEKTVKFFAVMPEIDLNSF
jgi:hypothetical protein